MSKFNVGDILKSKNPKVNDNTCVHALVLKWTTDSNEHHKPVYTVFNFNSSSEHTWNANHVDCLYERVS